MNKIVFIAQLIACILLMPALNGASNLTPKEIELHTALCKKIEGYHGWNREALFKMEEIMFQVGYENITRFFDFQANGNNNSTENTAAHIAAMYCINEEALAYLLSYSPQQFSLQNKIKGQNGRTPLEYYMGYFRNSNRDSSTPQINAYLSQLENELNDAYLTIAALYQRMQPSHVDKLQTFINDLPNVITKKNKFLSLAYLSTIFDQDHHNLLHYAINGHQAITPQIRAQILDLCHTLPPDFKVQLLMRLIGQDHHLIVHTLAQQPAQASLLINLLQNINGETTHLLLTTQDTNGKTSLDKALEAGNHQFIRAFVDGTIPPARSERIAASTRNELLNKAGGYLANAQTTNNLQLQQSYAMSIGLLDGHTPFGICSL